MHGNPPSPALDHHLHGPPQHPATTSHPESAFLIPWATAADRQAAARDAYRASVTEGKALTGAALGTMFDRSARWGVDRIAELRAEANQRRNGSNQQPATDAAGATPALRNGSDRSNGSGAGDTVLPIRYGNRRMDSRAAAGAAPACACRS